MWTLPRLTVICAGSVLEDHHYSTSGCARSIIRSMTFPMTELAIIYMKAYRHLLAFDHLVGYARIVRIVGEVGMSVRLLTNLR
jgi:hypothetical protein